MWRESWQIPNSRANKEMKKKRRIKVRCVEANVLQLLLVHGREKAVEAYSGYVALISTLYLSTHTV